MEREILTVDALAMAMAARNSGGTVIVQVERIAKPDAICSRDVVIPGIMVDHVVVARPEHHMQTFGTSYKPELSGELRVPLAQMDSLPLDERKILARRASFELRPYDVINLGIGYPEAVSAIANEENILDYLTMTVEPGIIGGMPLGGLDFGAAVNGEAVIPMPDQFDFYDGGGLDLTCLGFAQCDQTGNVNASKFGPRIAGCGGFINISQNTSRVLFMGTFTTGGLEVEVEEGKVRILREGVIRKFVDSSDQITFCSGGSDPAKQEVLYITERCVFRLKNGCLELIEVAPGIDIGKDILDNMGFRPAMSDVREMDSRLFRGQPMGIREEFLLKELRARLSYDKDRNILTIDFNGLEVESEEDVENIGKIVKETCEKIGTRVNALINYNGFRIDDTIMDTYMAMGQSVINSYYSRVARHNTNEGTRARFDSAYRRRNLAANIFASPGEALNFLSHS